MCILSCPVQSLDTETDAGMKQHYLTPTSVFTEQSAQHLDICGLMLDQSPKSDLLFDNLMRKHLHRLPYLTISVTQ
jgi:hypothetical protein